MSRGRREKRRSRASAAGRGPVSDTAAKDDRGIFGNRAARVAGVLGLPVAVVGLVFGGLQLWPGEPALDVAAFSIGKVQDIDAAFTAPDAVEPEEGQQDSEPLDVTLTNTGDGVGLITGFRITVTAVSVLDSCAAVGGGVDITAHYDAPVPVPPPATPFDVHGDIRFEVTPGSNDRLAIFVGPEERPSSAGVDAWLYSGNLTLIESGGRELEVGPFTVVAPPDDASYSLEYADPWNTACLHGNAELLTAAVGNGGAVSSYLRRLTDGYHAGLGD